MRRKLSVRHVTMDEEDAEDSEDVILLLNGEQARSLEIDKKLML